MNGIFEALEAAEDELLDPVWVQASQSVKLLRDGNNPVLRGTSVELGGNVLLHSTGSMQYHGTYPACINPARCCSRRTERAAARSEELTRRCSR